MKNNIFISSIILALQISKVFAQNSQPIVSDSSIKAIVKQIIAPTDSAIQKVLGQSISLTKSSQTLTLIDSIRVPTSPAFKLLGNEQSSVERPNDLKSLSLDLSKLTTDSNSLSKNFALEFGIGKLLSSSEKGIIDYYYPSVGENLWDNFTVSLATSAIPKDMFLDSGFMSSTCWSVGIRSQILTGTGSMSKNDFIESLHEYEFYSAIISNTVKKVFVNILQDGHTFILLQKNLNDVKLSGEEFLDNIDFDKIFNFEVINDPVFVQYKEQIKSSYPDFKNVIRYYLIKYIDSSTAFLKSKTALHNVDMITDCLVNFEQWSEPNIDQAPSSDKLAKHILSGLETKSGDVLEIAFALAGIARNDDISFTYIKRAGAWLTYDYRPISKAKWEGAFMARLLTNQYRNIKDSSNWKTFLDLGGRLISPRSWIASLSFEFLCRVGLSSNLAHKTEFRYAFIGEYPLTSNLYVTATVGKNYDFQLPKAPNTSNILSLLGIKYGFGSYTVINPEK